MRGPRRCYVWRTRHRQYRLTNNTGTHRIRETLGEAIFGLSKGEAALALIRIDHDLQGRAVPGRPEAA